MGSTSSRHAAVPQNEAKAGRRVALEPQDPEAGARANRDARKKQRSLRNALKRDTEALGAASAAVDAALDDQEHGRDFAASLRALTDLANELYSIGEDILASYLNNADVVSAFCNEDFAVAMETHVKAVGGAARQVTELLCVAVGARNAAMLNLAIHKFNRRWYEKAHHALYRTWTFFSDPVRKAVSKLCTAKAGTPLRVAGFGRGVIGLAAGVFVSTMYLLPGLGVLAGTGVAVAVIATAAQRCRKHKLANGIPPAWAALSGGKTAWDMQVRTLAAWQARFDGVYKPMMRAASHEKRQLMNAVLKEAKRLFQTPDAVSYSPHTRLWGAYIMATSPDHLRRVSCYMWLVAINIANKPECQAYRLMHPTFESTAAKTECVMSILHDHLSGGVQGARHGRVLQLMGVDEKEAVCQVDEVLRRYGSHAHTTAMQELGERLMREHAVALEDFEVIRTGLETHVWPRMFALATADPFSMVAQFCRAKRHATQAVMNVLNQHGARGDEVELHRAVFTAVWTRMFVELKPDVGSAAGAASAVSHPAASVAETKRGDDAERLLSSSLRGPLFLACVANYFAADSATAQTEGIAPAAHGEEWTQLGDFDGETWLDIAANMRRVTLDCAAQLLRTCVPRRGPRGGFSAADCQRAFTYCGVTVPAAAAATAPVVDSLPAGRRGPGRAGAPAGATAIDHVV